ncbi:hypothetical protein AB0M64_24530, partial [Streptomyces sp. NPDC051771]|uniref:hypothetical protein n=1 Tax=Streptomyces sp. NPDC051771 TaxID=3154847 RepID=UPI00341947AB
GGVLAGGGTGPLAVAEAEATGAVVSPVGEELDAGLLVEDLHRLLPELRSQPHPFTRDKTAATAFHH